MGIRESASSFLLKRSPRDASDAAAAMGRERPSRPALHWSRAVAAATLLLCVSLSLLRPMHLLLRHVDSASTPSPPTEKPSAVSGQHAKPASLPNSAHVAHRRSVQSAPKPPCSFGGYQTRYFSRGITNTGGGAVLSSPIKVYLTWVGSFPESRKKLLRDFVASLSPQADSNVTVDDWWNTTTLYWGGNFAGLSAPSGGWVTSNVSVGGETMVGSCDLFDWGVTTLDLQDSDVRTILSNSIAAAGWPEDPTAVYFVLTAANFTVSQGPVPFSCDELSSFSTCGWHDFTNSSGVPLLYAWVGVLPANCSALCWTNAVFPAVQDVPMQSAVNVFAQLLAKTASDPLQDAWMDTDWQESTDKCYLNFGSPSTWYNMLGIGGSKYLIQSNWNPQQGRCSLGLPTTKLAGPLPPPSPPSSPPLSPPRPSPPSARTSPPPLRPPSPRTPSPSTQPPPPPISLVSSPLSPAPPSSPAQRFPPPLSPALPA